MISIHSECELKKDPKTKQNTDVMKVMTIQ